ncbi:MAG: Rne/Rng family ribonuclease, partial [Abditibacteriales bacterium]|nr:Rne/Rng family ribonuclease [Abditibacteriales bacterium]MDW8367442.1 Rne/Rng family ribonuclease [Abditibacteriales bacterium]
MGLTILINVAPHETRLAVVEKGKVVDFEVEREGRLLGNVYKGRVVNVVPGMDAAFVDIGLSRNAFLYVGDVIPDALEAGEEFVPYSSIQEALNVGEEVIVQIARPPISGKGARVTTRISLPGRYLVLLPHIPEHIGISRKILQPEERSRLRHLAERIRPLDHGIIVRTEAEGRSESELLADLNELLDLWHQIEHKAAQSRAPLLLHADMGLIGRAVRDALTSDVAELLIDSEAEYHEVMEQVRRMAPHAAARVKLYTDDVPLFERYHVEQEIARALEVVVPLPSGGYITIEETEAFTAIDVNTHRYVGTNKLADTVLQTNLEAAEEVARQLRLRDIGGIIVVDFIDMERPRDRVKVMSALEEAVRKDRTRTRIVHISPLGLV